MPKSWSESIRFRYVRAFKHGSTFVLSQNVGNNLTLSTQTTHARSTWYSGDRIGTLDLGRTGHSQVTFLEEHWRVPHRQSKITQELYELQKNDHGLEFVRTWNVAVISAVILFPFILSLVFAGVWIGIYVARGTDVQVAVQTAFTVSSYIVTAGKPRRSRTALTCTNNFAQELC